MTIFLLRLKLKCLELKELTQRQFIIFSPPLKIFPWSFMPPKRIYLLVRTSCILPNSLAVNKLFSYLSRCSRQSPWNSLMNIVHALLTRTLKTQNPFHLINDFIWIKICLSDVSSNT